MTSPNRPNTRTLQQITREVANCRLCPRLVAWREEVAHTRRKAYEDQTYWGRPVPGFGDPAARLIVIGLAPAAHGANRTGRMFTGDRSGDWLFRALHRAGFANQAQSIDRKDGLRLSGAWITAGVRCAPPKNRPLPEERDTCRPFLQREIELLQKASVFLALGRFAYDLTYRLLGETGASLPRPRTPFGHCVEVKIEGTPRKTLLASFHPSQQNTFTGRLTESMFDGVFSRARQLVNRCH